MTESHSSSCFIVTLSILGPLSWQLCSFRATTCPCVQAPCSTLAVGTPGHRDMNCQSRVHQPQPVQLFLFSGFPGQQGLPGPPGEHLGLSFKEYCKSSLWLHSQHFIMYIRCLHTMFNSSVAPFSSYENKMCSWERCSFCKGQVSM